MPRWSLWLLSGASFVIYASQTVALFKSNPVMSNVIIIVYVVCVALALVLVKKHPNMNVASTENSDPSAKTVQSDSVTK